MELSLIDKRPVQFTRKICVVPPKVTRTYSMEIPTAKSTSHGNAHSSFSHLEMNSLSLSLVSFTVHGFRYITVFGSPNSLSTKDIECPVVHSETTVKGHFASSNPVINQIQHNVQWGQLGNSMSLPTDW